MPLVEIVSTGFALNQWCYLHGAPQIKGEIRCQPEDFRVVEELGFSPDCGNQHLWLDLSKRLLNTTEVASKLARQAGIPVRDVGYSGLKDRNAVTRQWFSLPVGINDDQTAADLTILCQQQDQLDLHQIVKTRMKLKRGVHRANCFQIIIRKLHGPLDILEEKLRLISEKGVPNYFGDQRFGRNGNNLKTAVGLFEHPRRKIDRFGRSMAISSARSWLFNMVLSARLQGADLEQVCIGDVMQLSGTNAWFVHDGSDPAVVDRVKQHDLHITGPLWGGGDLPSTGEIAEFEQAVVGAQPGFADGLVANGLRQQRRALRVVPEGMHWNLIDDQSIRIEFRLPRGSFATSVLRELVQT